MRLLVTRPEPDAERTAASLRAGGHEVLLAPLLRIEAIAADLGSGPWAALALTSANAVRAMAEHPQRAALLALPVYTVGRRTAEAAREVGFAKVMSADGDVKDLARLIAAQASGRLLYLAGEDRANDLAAALAHAGIDVQTRVVYRAAPVAAFPADVRAALSAGRVDGVLHFSRRSAAVYIECAGEAGILVQTLAPRHYCLSRQVAEPLIAAGAADIRVAGRPTEADLTGLIAAK
jgi:uroporphyrinogen-III synthase